MTLSFNLTPGVALGQAVDAIEAMTERLHVPATVTASFEGTAQAFQASLSSMPLLVAAAILVVYIVLGVLYESYIHPITILSALPSAGVGALLMLMLLHYELSVIAIVGIILLIGIVKKNAIMMIDFALQAARIEGKAPQEAIHQACLLRFRPIMMTTFAALFGAVPIAFGSGAGAELRQPLGVAIIGGLLVSQWLTLYTTPVIYLYLERLSRWLGRSYGLSHAAEALSELPAGPLGRTWYVAYPIRYRQLEEMMEERGAKVDHSSLNRWVIKYVPLLDQAHGGDGSGANDYNEAHDAEVEIRQVKYLNNVVEQDHRAIKRQVRPMMGFKSFWSAATLAGDEELRDGCVRRSGFMRSLTDFHCEHVPPRRRSGCATEPAAGDRRPRTRGSRASKPLRSRHLRRLQAEVFIGCGIGEARYAAEIRLCHARANAVDEGQLPDRCVHCLVDDQLLHLFRIAARFAWSPSIACDGI